MELTNAKAVSAFQTKHKISQKNWLLLMEAYRRIFMFHSDENKKNAWLGLGYTREYKSKYFVPTTIEQPRIMSWYKLSDEGFQMMETIIKEFPLPKISKEKERLNNYLFSY